MHSLSGMNDASGRPGISVRREAGLGISASAHKMLLPGCRVLARGLGNSGPGWSRRLAVRTSPGASRPRFGREQLGPVLQQMLPTLLRILVEVGFFCFRAERKWPWVKIQIGFPPVNNPTTKIGSTMGGEFIYSKMGSHWF